MALWTDILISSLIVFGGFFLLVGSLGLVKLPEIMMRLHAPTKATTLGVGSVLVASMLYFAIVLDNISIHELVITLFLFLTAPITANFIAKSHLHRRGSEAELPSTHGEEGWATFDPPPDQREAGEERG